MNQRQLSYFVEVYKRKSIKKSADYLMISSQGLSKVIKSLEDELKVKLFLRTKYTYEPTRDADKLLPHALTIIDEYSKIESPERLFNRKVIIYAIDGTLDYFTLDFMNSFYRDNPGICLKVIEASNQEAINHIKNRDGDFAILQHECDLTDFHNVFLFECPFCFVINKNNPLSKLESISIEKDARLLDRQCIAGRGFEYILYDQLIKKLSNLGSHPNTILESNNEKLLLSLADNNRAIACVSKQVAIKNKNEYTKICNIAEKDVNDHIYLSYKTNTELSLEAHTFMKYLINWISKNQVQNEI